MKIELHGIGWEPFAIPRYCGGVAVNEGNVWQDGKYPVKAINMVTVLSSDHLYIAVALRDDDEHLPQLIKPTPEELEQVI